MRKSVLILGSSGRFGRHAAEAFWNAGWAIHTFDRARDNLIDAATGVDVIIAAWNPPYTDWAEQVLPLHQQVQDAARSSGAMVIVPSNVYVYAPDAPLPWRPETTHTAQNPLGHLRIKMEQSYRDSGVQTLFLRAGDFMDTEPTGNWLDKVILKNLHKGWFTYPGQWDAPHSWAWLPDLARAAVSLAERRVDLGQTEDVCFEGHTLTGREFARALASSMGRKLRVRQMPWWPLQLARPVWPMAKHLLEMRYLWNTPHQLDGSKLRQLCPDYRDTPLSECLTTMVTDTASEQRCHARSAPVESGSLRLS